jgi:Alpha/beta hydrolase family
MVSREESPSASDELTAWKRVARQPWLTVLLDRLSLLHPITWWRLALFKRIDLKPALYSAAAVALPAACISLRCDRSADYLKTYLMSPWTLAWMWKVAATAKKVADVLKDLHATQNEADPLAWKFLASRVQEGRAYRERRYDVYLPKNPANARPILFFTGAYVEHVAYAEPASLLADDGYLVVVVSAEPLRIIDTWLPRFQPYSLRGVQRSIERRHGCTSDWVFAGHSMGSFACTKLATALGVKTIVMWGSAPFVDFMADISATEIRVLVVQATKDMIIDMFATPEATRRFWELLPASTARHDIVDGTHSGFGNYTSTWKPELDGIPVAEQHSEAIRATLDFLKQ